MTGFSPTIVLQALDGRGDELVNLAQVASFPLGGERALEEGTKTGGRGDRYSPFGRLIDYLPSGGA